MSLTFPLHYFSVHQSLCHLLIWLAVIFFLIFFLVFFTVRFLKSTSHNLCRLPSATLSHNTESLFTITFLNLTVSQFLIHSMLCLLYWFLHHSSFPIKILSGTESNALQESKYITLSWLLLSISLVTSSKKIGNVLCQSLFSINPGWLALIALFSFNAVLIKFSLFSCFILPWTAELLTALLWTQDSLIPLKYCHSIIFPFSHLKHSQYSKI